MEIPEIYMGVGSLQRGSLCKAIQITIDGAQQMYFADDKTATHAGILKKVLELNGIPYVEVEVWNKVAPDIRGERYAVSGMGGAVMLRNKKVLFFGNSLDYGIRISEPHLKEIQKQYPDWTFSLSSLAR